MPDQEDNSSTDTVQNLKYGPDGLIPAIVQDDGTGEVLMMAYMNQESLRMTLERGFTHFWSRSRKKFWMKGESSGHVQEVKGILYDCDRDTLLIRVVQKGPGACHTGHRSCFFTAMEGREIGEATFGVDEAYQKQPVLERLVDIIRERRETRQEGSYVSSLMERGREAVLKKVGEEATEVVLAGAQGDRRAMIRETADLWFHTLIALVDQGIALEEVYDELRSRRPGKGKE